ncbi:MULTISPECIES: membrane protein insertase YidC [unclassified Actinopolyspora]|uniref:membrane protein insertase YidC n=1 Tax=unclassified Actinopolyspora TaxID=2639451 RepID=UPI0013F5D138|nr:membrane protein insertase YidC [Actinopolyspora sp. BKK2]NHE77353.1 membrane protein insertase YidC [Actinopolyspora sp. BKK1]
MLDFINYPVSAILWFWHSVFGSLLDPDSGFAWALSVIFLVFTLRALLFKPFVHQVRSMRKMQEVAPRIQELQKEYAHDRQRLASEMQKLQSEQGFNPVSGCLPILVQVPVFIGLFQVLNGFHPGEDSNFVFGEAGVNSFLDAHLFGASLSTVISAPAEQLASFGTDRASMLLVGVPLMIAAAVATHFTSRHSVERQRTDQRSSGLGAPGQQAMMNRMVLWVFPMFAIIGGPFLPLAILLYWLANNFWTLGQQYVVYRRIDREEAQRAPSEDSAATAAVVDSTVVSAEDPPERSRSDEQAELPGIPEDRSSETDAPDERR